MTRKRSKFKRFLIKTSILISGFCLMVYAFDLFFGDGDGILEKIHLNPLILFLLVQPFLLCLIGIFSRKTWVSNTSLVVLTTFVLCFLVEIGLHFSGDYFVFQKNHLIEPQNQQAVFSKYDTAYFKNYMPHSHFTTHIKGQDGTFSIYNHINGDAIRGPEISSKKEGEQRILLLGDSFLQSDEVLYEQSVGQVLESLLPDSVQVIQHGNPSWSPLLELNWLLKKGLSLDPDHVILFPYYNDFFKGNSVGDEGYTPYCIFDEKGLPLGFRFKDSRAIQQRSPWTHCKDRLQSLNISKLWKSVFNKDSKAVQLALKPDELLVLPPKQFEKYTDDLTTLYEAKTMGILATVRDTAIWDERTKKRISLSLHYIRLMREVLEQKKIAFSIVLIPHPWQFHDEHQSVKAFYGFQDFILPRGGLENRMAKFCKEESIPFCPLYPAFQAYKQKQSDQLYFPVDGHWNPKGHQLAAKTIYQFLYLQTETFEKSQ